MDNVLWGKGGLSIYDACIHDALIHDACIQESWTRLHVSMMQVSNGPGPGFLDTCNLVQDFWIMDMCIMDTCIIDTCIIDTYMHHGYVHHGHSP